MNPTLSQKFDEKFGLMTGNRDQMAMHLGWRREILSFFDSEIKEIIKELEGMILNAPPTHGGKSYNQALDSAIKILEQRL